MGYDLHITRSEDWSDPDGTPIPLEEWRNFTTAHDDIHDVPITSPEGDIIMDDTGAGSVAVRLSTGDWAPLWWVDGNVVSKNPSREMVQFMARIAVELSARVQGDDGEVYGLDGEPLPEIEAPQKPSLLRRLLGR